MPRPKTPRSTRAGDLIGHLALANDLHRQLAPGQEVLAVFRAEDGYVSPNWYPSRAEHHRHVPTWNDAVVHCQGRMAAEMTRRRGG